MPPASSRTRQRSVADLRSAARRRGRAIRDAQGPAPPRHLSRCSANCSRARREAPRRRERLMHAARSDAPALLYQGADWDFDTIRGSTTPIERDRASSELGLDVYPNQIEVITRRADARRLFLDRHAAVLQALVVRQAFRPATRPCYRKGLQRPRLRDRHQLQSLHQLHHGGEHHDDADAGASRTPPSATTTSSRTTTCSSSGPTPTASSTISNSPRTTSPHARSATARPRSSACSTRRMRCMSHGVHRYPRKTRAGPRARRSGASASAARRRSRSTTISGAPCRARAARAKPRPDDETPPRPAASCRRRTSSTSSRRPRPACSPGSARSCASCA